MCGYATFGPALPAACNTTNDQTPQTTAPNGVLAPFWDYLLRNSPSGNLLMQRMSNYTIISWQDFGLSNGSACHVNFQQKLFDDGTIEFHYGAVMSCLTDSSNLFLSSGGNATVWLEKPDGTAALPISVHTALGILPNTAYRFTPY
jgi:hypothetical protein